MDNAVATVNPTPLVPLEPAQPSLGARWTSLPGRSQAMAVLGVAALLAVLAMMFIGARDADYRPLFTNLSDKEGGQVIDRLVQMNVPYKFAEGSSVILVPSGRVNDLRMKLAAQGIPAGGGNGLGAGSTEGYELMDKNSFGQTQNQERFKMQRAIQGELSNAILSIDGVKGAKVFLAMAQQNGFFREQQKPSASVSLNLQPGRTLDRGQIAGIVRLVAGSVPELAPKAVNIVDQTGTLLWPANEENAQGLDSQQLQYRRDIEAGLQKRVMALLEPVVGRDNVRATVTADLDFSQSQQTTEAYRPNQGPDAKPAIREQRTEESTQAANPGPSGVPGATSNQPPTPATAPINGPAQPLQAAQGNGGPGLAQRKEAATRFEVDRTTTVTQSSPGTVRRLNAAVVVNHRTTVDAKGKPQTVPLSDKEVEQLTALVQQGIGFNAERGDAVKVINAPFRVEAAQPSEEVPLWKQPWVLDLLKSAAAPAALALVALVIVLKLIKPALSAMFAPPPPPEPGTQLSEVVDDEPALAPVLALPDHSAKIESARALAKANPAAVANIVRGWVNGETA
jgi:flagellar M-ring protein FliF